MELDADTPNASRASRRKSGRAVRQPAVFSREHHVGSVLTNGASKRKRAHDGSAENEGEEEQDVTSEDDGDDEDEEDDEPDEEELKEQRRAKRAKAAPAKPAAKRAKTTSRHSTTLAIRSANIRRKPAAKASKTTAQKARARPSQAQRQGLYAEVFGKGQSPEDAASVWFESVQKDSVVALRDMINFILQCVGCNSEVETQDIEDLDSVPNKLGDVLLEYEQQKASDYPLASKQKQYAGFQDVLEEFFAAIIKALHASSAFYEQPEIYDNIHVWVATMSGANYKSFRHTATIISLAMTTALCEVAKEIQDTMATLKNQLDAEKKKRNANKARIKSIEKSLEAAETNLEAIDAQLKDAFDTVYMHRYRDVEERIRAPCVAALGNWIVIYRKMFLEGQYLRYLGWVLNDTSASTRLEDIKQLKRLFTNKRNIAALRAFTDRFRSRLVEMGARDAHINVRIEAIELLDRLRDAELLEPDDIDTIGRLIFDSDPAIRKAVAKFFVSNLEDLYTATIEDFDQNQYTAALPESGDVEDFKTPNQSWIKFKCLGSVLAGYDNDDESLDEAGQSLPLNSVSDSRYTLATQSIFPHLAELRQWESLAGYLLYDHSSIPSSGDDDDVEYRVQQAYKLSSGEDTILLDVLHAAVKSYLQSTLEPPTNRRTNATKDQIREKQETAAQNLTVILPQLLNKFGSTPQAASSILRIEQLLDISLISDLQSGQATYSVILDAISKQFTSHSDKQVLAAASAAFRNARSYEQSKEAADAKVQEIWTELVTALANLLRNKAVGNRGMLDKQLLTEVVDIVIRLAELAGVHDCSHVVEGKLPSGPSGKEKGKVATQQTLLNLLFRLLQRGKPDEDTTATFAELEDQLCTAVMELFSLYFRWKVFGMKQAIAAQDEAQLSATSLRELAVTRANYVEHVGPIIQMRAPQDPVRYQAILSVLELFALFSTIQNRAPDEGELDDEVETILQSLMTKISDEIVKEVLTTFEKIEKSFAKRTHRKIEIIGGEEKKSGKATKTIGEGQTQEEIERPPEDSEDDEARDSDAEEGHESEDEDTEEGKKSKNTKKQAALLAEQSLCELTSKIIFAIWGKAIKDEKGIKQRLLLNRNKLGKNYSAIVGYLESNKKKKGKAPTKKAVEKATNQKGSGKTVNRDDEVDSIDDPDAPDEQDLDDEEAQQQRDLKDEDDEIENQDRDDEAEEQEGEEVSAGEDDIMGD
ncbi:hypothetical protein PV04_09122 [Phialophora macrospora]|uniref:SCD domain-containing protein n=1 Tax=Phialophora macrospora TaxID=1851006 RepID=A0A0D2FVZ6_9EURO|nr:hypothetical protein PV04_09122 [Phialophora macrospora]